jgi:hypothetical protein
MINFRTFLNGWKPRLGGNGTATGFSFTIKTTFRRFSALYGTPRIGSGQGQRPSLVDHPDYAGRKTGSCSGYPAKFSLFGFRLCRTYPSQVHAIPADDPRRYAGPAWRIDTRGPGDMMKPGAFFGNGADDDIRKHILGGIGAHHSSRLCSWSSTPSGTHLVAHTFAHALPDASLFLYEARLHRHNAFDASGYALLKAIRTRQAEVVCTRVGLRDVTAVTLPTASASRGKKVLFPFWPHSELSIDSSVVNSDPMPLDLSIY